jgi:epoxyqueuosine reductase
MPSSADEHTRIVKAIATDLGFDQCGVAAAKRLDEEEDRLATWLKKGYQGQMHYLAIHYEERLDPCKLVPGARSVISLIYNYYPKQDYGKSGQYKIAKYAYGRDYHKVIRKKLKDFLHRIQEQIGQVSGRAFVDSAPVMERQWAAKSGLGWQGKNTLLLNRQMGSFFFLAELILDLELVPDHPLGDYCGTCTRCLDACPTQAFPAPGVLDARRCISYLTIELKDSIDQQYASQMNDWIFGCDICQDVCPWNRFARPHHEPDFEPRRPVADFTNKEWEELTEEVFEKAFEGSALKRTKYKGLKRNIDFIKKRTPPEE